MSDDYVPAIYGPPGWDIDGYIEQLNWGLLAHPHYRRLATRADPMMFALIYLTDSQLISEETGGHDVHLSQFHVDLAESARRWMRHDFGPKEIRECWVAPRGAAKSTWLSCVLPLWALAHQHKEFLLLFTANDDAAAGHLDNLRTELRTNTLLRQDYPELCTPSKADGKTRGDTRNIYIAESGVGIMAFGIDSNRLGTKLGKLRPKLILLDDIEPAEGNYSVLQKDARLATVRAILPMNENAPVQWVGTTTMYGSAVHDLVRHHHDDRQDWVADDGWSVRYYPPLVVIDGRPVSMWPARWPTEYLLRERDKRAFALHYENNPRSIEDGLWTPGDIEIVADAPLGPQVLSIDPGVTSKRTSDPTGMAVVSRGARLVVEWADSTRRSPADLKAFVAEVAQCNPRLNTVLIETNQGGEHWANLLRPVLPPGVELVEKHTSVGKHGRFERLLDFYQDRRIVHWGEFGVLTRQMFSYPKVDHDDVIDAVCLAAEHLLAAEWGRKPRSPGRRG